MSPFKKLSAVSALCLVLGGCLGALHIRENLAEGQIIDPAVIRKPSGDKSWATVSKYDDFLEGYILGGLNGLDGKPLEGITVKVSDDKGSLLPQFSQGVTDHSGIYKIRFSLPIQWNRLDFTATLTCHSPGWQIAASQTKFRIYFNRKTGTLAYYPREIWFAAKNDAQTRPALKSIPLPQKKLEKSPPKKGSDSFGDFSFEP